MPWRKIAVLATAGYALYAAAVIFALGGRAAPTVESVAFPTYAAAAAAPGVGAHLVVPQPPEGAPADLPPGLLPDLVPREPRDLHLVGSAAAGNLRLKFTTTIWNAGGGPVEVRGAEDPASGEQRVVQFVHDEAGAARVVGVVGTFDYSHRHGHIHFAGFARYELWSLDETGALDERLVVNHKVGFCLMDNVLIEQRDATPAGPTYLSCDADTQGISVGYGDMYVAQLYEQDLNVSGVPDGTYALVNVVNPEGTLLEADYENNAAVVYLWLRGGHLVR